MLSFLRFCRCSVRRETHRDFQRLCLSSVAAKQPATSTPWFIDAEPTLSTDFVRKHRPPHLPQHEPDSLHLRALPPLPTGLPDHLIKLHADLAESPHLDHATLEIRRPLPTQPGPPLPTGLPKGRRKRGRTNVGLGVPDLSGGVWRWIVLAQVKEGTENRGAIESVVRVVRKSLLTAQPSLPLPPNSKRKRGDGWAMIDVGDFAVHILSQTARESYFPTEEMRSWEW